MSPRPDKSGFKTGAIDMHRIPFPLQTTHPAFAGFHVLFSLYIYDTISAVRNAHLEKNPKCPRAAVVYHPHK